MRHLAFRGLRAALTQPRRFRLMDIRDSRGCHQCVVGLLSKNGISDGERNGLMERGGGSFHKKLWVDGEGVCSHKIKSFGCEPYRVMIYDKLCPKHNASEYIYHRKCRERPSHNVRGRGVCLCARAAAAPACEREGSQLKIFAFAERAPVKIYRFNFKLVPINEVSGELDEDHKVHTVTHTQGMRPTTDHVNKWGAPEELFQIVFGCEDTVAKDNFTTTEYKIDDGNESEITMDEIMKALKHMKVGKAAGYDRVSSEMLRGGGGTVTGLLYQLFNKCWKSHREYECGLRMDGLSVKCLLYVYDQVMFVPSTCGLQKMVNEINDSVKERGMNVRVDKTKLMVFKRGESTTEYVILIEVEKVEQVK
ncbi:hypothetical protein EVAR_22750_1 [Eumeta japonica]|uniref:Reverse transcriptase domain-containing protein n=1 Tax=Eumeta variegata TaxID=151549 RepID=A0A4C1USF0_EUMVA|nr:hypothetical protein EVAR_22750_1 [Eumeta japonica]